MTHPRPRTVGAPRVRPPRPTGVYFYAPANFRPEDISGLAGLEAEAYWLLHRIVTKHASRRDEPFVRLSRKSMMRAIHPRRISATLFPLIEAGVIECNGVYRPGVCPKGYRLGRKLLTSLRRVECGNVTVARREADRRRLARTRWAERSAPDPTLAPVLDHLGRWLRMVKIDAGGALGAIEARAAVCRRRRRGRKAARMFWGFLSSLAVHQIADRHLELSADRYGRVHSPVTSLASVARAYLGFADHAPLVSLDIRNSQPVFLTLLMRRPERGDCGTGPASSLDAAYRGSPAELEAFAGLVESGRLYDELLERYAMRCPAAPPMDRDTFKRRFFAHVLYGDPRNRYTADSGLARAFAEEFAGVWAFIADAKRHGHAGLAHAMQRAESEFFIRGVCGRLAREHPTIPLLTIHDCVLTPGPFEPVVRSIIAEEFGLLGIRAAIETKPLARVTKPAQGERNHT